MPQQLSSTHTIIPRALIVYRRERSEVWQVRIKVGERWIRRSTKERKLPAAIEKAKELMVEAEIRRREGLPAITKRFRDVAQLAIKRMQEELESGAGKSSYTEYILIIERYLIPVLGKRLITNINNEVLLELEERRKEIMGRVPKRSTLLSHNAALNKVFDEAVVRGLMAQIERPELQLSGKKSERHAAFEPNEVAKLLSSLEDWVAQAKSTERQQGRELLRDYVEVLLGTGARPGKELMNLKWSQIKVVIEKHPSETETYWDDELHRDVETPKVLRHLVMTVTGKTGTREMLGLNDTLQALTRIAKRNHHNKVGNVINPIEHLVKDSKSGYVFRLADGKKPTSFAKLFDRFLSNYDLKNCPKTGKARVFYSLRHTYATLRLTYDAVPIHTLAEQMGTSVTMIEKHYSHLRVYAARYQLLDTQSQLEIARYKQTLLTELDR